jgi:hypothetical protein
MKRFITGIIALAALATANAQTPISSVNAAGYIKVTVEVGKYYFLQTPFNKFDGSQITISDVLGTSLPGGSQVFAWNVGTQQYDSSNYFDGIGWIPDLDIRRGEGFFVYTDGNGGPTSFDVFLAGEVPGASTAAQTTIALQAGYNSIGFPYPVATTLANSGLTQATTPGDQVFLWDPNGTGYTAANRFDIPSFEWGGNETLAINPGQALFVQSQAPLNYVATVPYSWPNN